MPRTLVWELKFQWREKVDTAKLEHFLDFITSNQVIKDLPLGEKTLTLSTGEIIQTPYVIRCLAPATIVRQYSQLCIEENFEPIGKFYFSTRYQFTCLSMFIYALFFCFSPTLWAVCLSPCPL